MRAHFDRTRAALAALGLSLVPLGGPARSSGVEPAREAAGETRPAGQAWLIGEPDETFLFRERARATAGGPTPDGPRWTCVESERAVPRDLWVTGLQVLPAAGRAARYARVEVLSPPRPVRKHAATRVMEALAPWTRARKPPPPRWEYLAGYLPGEGPRTYGEGVARRLPKGSRLRIAGPAGPSEAGSVTTLGLSLADGPTPSVAEAVYVPARAVDGTPAGKVTWLAELPAAGDAHLRSLNPPAHRPGTSFDAVAVHPDGTEEALVQVRPGAGDRRASHVFDPPRALPGGTRIRATWGVDGAFDASDRGDAPETGDPHGEPDEPTPMLAVEWIRPREAAPAR